MRNIENINSAGHTDLWELSGILRNSGGTISTSMNILKKNDILNVFCELSTFNFCKFPEISSTIHEMIREAAHFEFGAVQKRINLADLANCWKMML